MSHDETADPSAAADSMAARGSVERLRLGRFDEVRPRLLARLVPSGRAGPLARRPPTTSPGRRSWPVLLDVGVDLPGAIARIDDDLLDAWAASAADIWRAAAVNLRRCLEPRAIEMRSGSIRFRIVTAGPWTTGLLLDPYRLAIAGPAVAVAPNGGVLVVAARLPAAELEEIAWLTGPALALAADLAAVDSAPRLEPVPVVLGAGALSQPGGFWNDVPVSRDPGLR